MAAAISLLLLVHSLSIWLVRVEYLVGFSQKTIKVPLASPRPSNYAAISVKTKATVITGQNRSNYSTVSFSASYLGNLNRWSLTLGHASNQSEALHVYIYQTNQRLYITQIRGFIPDQSEASLTWPMLLSDAIQLALTTGEYCARAQLRGEK